jgi:V8-like Glu-specific endopeptidase
MKPKNQEIQMNTKTTLRACSLALLLSILVLVTGGFGGEPQAAYAQIDAELVSSRGAPEALAATRPYTKEEMLNAVPYDLIMVDSAKANEGVSGDSNGSQITGEPGSDLGGLPGGSSEPFMETFLQENLYAGIELLTTGTGYPPPFTRYENFDAYKVYPYRTVGKLFFRPFGSTGTASCTASSIGNFAIWTAGHCVSDGAGHFHSNWVFVPAYRSGTAPYGQWTGSVAWTFTDWHNSGNLSRDSGGVVLNLLNGVKISQRVGLLGFAWNQNPLLVHWHSIGYPGNIASALRQIICASGLAERDTAMPAPNPVGMGCDMTQGSSGGPWIKNFSGVAGASNYLNGNVSYGYGNKPLEFFSPYFDNSSKALKDALVADTP